MPVGSSIQKFVLILALVIVSCKGENKNPEDNSSTEVGIVDKKASKPTLPAPGSMNGDTINLSGKFVLFFGPTESVDPKQSAASGEIAAFRQTSTEVIDSLKVVPHLSSAYSNADYFRIYAAGGTPMVVSKKALNSETGVLFTDGYQPPTIKKGIKTSAEYLKLIREYFFLK